LASSRTFSPPHQLQQVFHLHSRRATVQVPNLALTLTKQIIVYKADLTDYLQEHVQESLLSSASSRTSSPGEEDRMQHTMDMDILQVGNTKRKKGN
jgi:hypothetical protein